jgi:sec-independent protein translocase protein TatC
MFGKNSDSNPEAEMGFFDHVEALRWHLIRSLIAILVCSGIVGYFYEFVFDKIILGIQSKDFPTYRVLCWISQKAPFLSNICIDHDLKLPLQNTAMFGQVTLLLQYSFILGFIVAFPYVMWELWSFVAPAIRGDQAKKTGKVIFACSAFFFVGVLFCYFIIIPFCVNFSINFTISNTIHNNFTIDNYMDFFSMLLLAIGAIFELPMIVYFLSKIGILKPSAMRKGRRYAILIIFIVAGILTPSPDIFTQILVAAPMLLLYEISIAVSARVEKQHAQRSTTT